MNRDDDSPSVSSCFSGKSVLVTGVSGFLGKMIVWKLLRDVPTCQTIHVLLRPQNSTSPEQRLQKILCQEPFATLAPEVDLSRVVAIAGDVYASSTDAPSLELAPISQFDVIIHSAALTQWDAPLVESLRINAYGSLALLTNHLTSGGTFVYVSSAFAFGIPPTISKEVVWEGPVPVSHVDFDAIHREAELHSGTREARGRAAVALARKHGWWDPYALSKAAAETFLAAKAHAVGANLAVVRPSGLVGAIAEPAPGWHDAYTGTVPFILALSTKQMTMLAGSPGAKIDWFPADLTVNVVVVAAAGVRNDPSKSASYFHTVSHDTNPVTLHEAHHDWSRLLERRGMGPIPSVDWKGTAEEFEAAVYKKVSWLRTIHTALDVIPIVRNMSAVTGRLQRMLQQVDKLVGLAKLYSPYMINEWRFDSSCTQKLMNEQINKCDQGIFPYKTQDFSWNQLWDIHVDGIYKYVLPRKAANQRPQKVRSRL